MNLITEQHQRPLGSRERKIGRHLTRALRHGKIGNGETIVVDLREDGFVKLSKLNALFHEHLQISLEKELCLRIVAQDKKQRFFIVQHGEEILIRASQGHSVSSILSEKLLTRIESAGEIPILIHGTVWKAFQPILNSGGISRMNRNNVHLTTALPHGNVISGMRSSSEVAIYVDSQRAMDYGIDFYKSSNGVILTPSLIPVECFQKVINIRDGSMIHY